MPRPKYQPANALKILEKRRREPSPEIAAEGKKIRVESTENEAAERHSPSPLTIPSTSTLENDSPIVSEAPSVEPFTEDDLNKFITEWPGIPPEEHDAILYGVYESAVQGVGFHDSSIAEIYSFFIDTIPIRGQKTQGSAYVAFCSCQKAKLFDVSEKILKSLIRSMRLALTHPLHPDDVLFLVNKIPEYPVRFASLIEVLESENHSVRLDHLRIPDDAKVLESTSESVPVGFRNALDLLENVHRVDVKRRDLIHQVKMILDHIFKSRRDLLWTHGRPLAKIIQKLQYCPESAIGAIKYLADFSSGNKDTETKRRFSAYALSLVFLSHLDVLSPRVIGELREIIDLIFRASLPGTRMVKDILGAFKELHRNSRYGSCSAEEESIHNLIMDRVMEIIKHAITYGEQLEIVKFLEDLGDCSIPNDLFLCLCEKSEGPGIINRICALLLAGDRPARDKNIRAAIKKQVERLPLNNQVVRNEYPHLYQYMRKPKV
ncbi:uncharacterized protein LOC100904291 [Galendromus occidentalis]|uniref:Uncharacterized protein LOC100904291 n=1 Tax=Galendromus occidentalis TaxID=34638 RepID=A0AAJ6QY79_9ACAR|nr:uncharacterized protein LOC100904291 [Galendromus occidentalis]